MLFYASVLLYLVSGAIGDDPAQPRIVVVGAGPAGIAAASKLLENGFTNVLVVEAENRIGGRINTTHFDDYVIDLGAQWIHGENGNVAYELASPLGLTEHSTMENKYYDLYTLSGNRVSRAFHYNLTNVFFESMNVSSPDNPHNTSIGDLVEEKFKEFFADHEVNETMQKALLWHYDVVQTAHEPAESWYDLAIDGLTEFDVCEGDQWINWKERGYGTILDILMKKIPNPDEELPTLNHTHLNEEVTKIDYADENEPIKITTTEGVISADHVIFTPSLGVLKAQYETLFHPSLPETKINTIKGLGFGTVTKIFLSFHESWWNTDGESSGFSILFTEDERKEYGNNPNTKWLSGVAGYGFVQYKPRILLVFISGVGARDVEDVPDEEIQKQVMNTLRNTLSQDYNITEPTGIIRSHWYKNKHFRGTYSFRSIESANTGAQAEILAVPIEREGKPIVMFAGEATNKDHYSTVHGAIGSGWREANRLINIYRTKNTEA
ncbi:hypothetical protein KM043_006710 [Ampulex compressa]|nr:hypothetical protein KM043_006710 [Ampulex compressa]